MGMSMSGMSSRSPIRLGRAKARLPEDPGPARRATRIVPSDELRPGEVAELRELFDEAWSDDAERFTEQDWGHAVGGVHVIAEADGRIAAHASVVERELRTANHRLRTGYVEAVATRPSHQRRGLGSLVIEGVDDLIDRNYQLGALATGVVGFYERLGWVAWQGPTSVRTEAGTVRTADEDGNVLVRLTPSSPELDLSAPISCEWRPGDAW
jgi:aminoglycoside 2'-N-acetyltransferase I